MAHPLEPPRVEAAERFLRRQRDDLSPAFPSSLVPLGSNVLHVGAVSRRESYQHDGEGQVVRHDPGGHPERAFLRFKRRKLRRGGERWELLEGPRHAVPERNTGFG